MKRRQFLTLLAGATAGLLLPNVSLASQSNITRVMIHTEQQRVYIFTQRGLDTAIQAGPYPWRILDPG